MSERVIRSLPEYPYPSTIPGYRRWLLKIRTTTRGERVEAVVEARSRADAIRIVLRRAVFKSGEIEVARVEVEEYSG